MKILVTGTAGFIGFHLARKLIERGKSLYIFIVGNMTSSYKKHEPKILYV